MPDNSVALQFDGRLTNIATQYKNGDYIGDLVVPPTPVGHKKFTYKQYSKNERFTLPTSLVGRSGTPNEVDYGVTEATGTCADHGYEGFVANDDMDNAETPLSPMADQAEFVRDKLMLDHEKRVADFVFNASNYATANKIDIAGAWATLSTDALTQLEVGIDACLVPPNVLVMGLPTWRKLARNEKILAAVKGTLAPQQIKSPGGQTTPRVTIPELAEYLGLDAVLIGKAFINTANEGQAATFARVWDGTNAGKGGAALLRVKAGGALRDIVWGANFTWKGAQAFTYQTQRGARGGTMVRVTESHILTSVATDVGYLFQDCLVT